VRAEKAQNFAAFRLEADVVDGRAGAVSLRQMLDLGHLWLLFSCSCVWAGPSPPAAQGSRGCPACRGRPRRSDAKAGMTASCGGGSPRVRGRVSSREQTLYTASTADGNRWAARSARLGRSIRYNI